MHSRVPLSASTKVDGRVVHATRPPASELVTGGLAA